MLQQQFQGDSAESVGDTDPALNRTESGVPSIASTFSRGDSFLATLAHEHVGGDVASHIH
jgi:hypothetical protein